MVRMDTIRREARGIALALVVLAITTAVAVALETFVGIRRGSFIYLLSVLIAGWNFGLIPALLVAVASVFLNGYLFYSNDPNFWLGQPREIIDLSVFLVCSLVA